MLIVDGVPMALGYLSSINPNDIADVSVLKSSSGTAIYGPDGVNGAIVVTTKRGNATRPIVTVSHTTQLEKISYMPDFQDRFGAGYSPDAMGYGTYEPIEQQSWGDEFDGSVRQVGQDGPNGERLMLPYSNIKNARRDFFNTGKTHQTDLSYSAGNFYISAQNVAIRGIMPGDRNDRRSVTLRADKETGKFRAGFTMRYTQQQYDITTNNQAIWYTVTGAPGNIPVSRFSDWRNDWFSSPDGYYTPYLDNIGKTPYFAKDNWRQTGGSDDLFGNGELNFAATNWLRFTYRVGFTWTSADATSTRGAFNYSAFHNTLRDHGSLNITAAVTDASSISKRLNSEIFATINKKFGKFGVKSTIGQSYREVTTSNLSVGSNNLGNATTYTVQLRKGEPAVGEGDTKYRLERYFGSVDLDYNNWAFVGGTVSLDFDSRFAKPGMVAQKDDIQIFYPGMHASVLLSEAIPAIKNSKVISYLKLRGAISETGNAGAIGIYAYENVFNPALFFPYGDVLGFTASLTSNDVNLKPENVLNREVGLEMSFLKNRINFEAAYYNQDNTEQVLNVQLSPATGITTARQNAGAFTNKGYEFDLRLTPLVKLGNVNIDFKVNYTKQESEVTRVVEGLDEIGIGNFNYAIVGQPAFVFKLTDYIRDDQGRVIVDGVTGLPTQNPNLTQFGQTNPTDLLGLNLNVSWKNLTFSAVADYRSGGYIVVDQLGGFMDDNGISARSAANGRRAFVFPNSSYEDPGNPGKYIANTNLYTHLYGRLFWNSDLVTAVTTNYLANGAFWKLREVAINYEIPVGKIFGSGFSNVLKRASFTLSGRNLLMWLPESNVWNMDPEFQGGNGNSAYTGNATGRLTAYNFPPTRIFGATLSLGF
jgi:TonB-dependent SusC/RagA subfamily outer membrane receptor